MKKLLPILAIAVAIALVGYMFYLQGGAKKKSIVIETPVVTGL